MVEASKKAKKDPFKTKKSKNTSAKENDTMTPPEDIAQAIDAFRECQDQAKHFEGESTVHKDAILRYAQELYTGRLFNGNDGSFKILGDETMVTYVMMDSSAGLTEEDLEALEERWGEKAAEELVCKDYRSIRFDPKVLEANYDQVVKALQALPEEVLDNLFKPMLMKTQEKALEKAKKYAKTPEEMRELMHMLKIKNYIR
mgnify:CR=1 FL=1